MIQLIITFIRGNMNILKLAIPVMIFLSNVPTIAFSKQAPVLPEVRLTVITDVDNENPILSFGGGNGAMYDPNEMYSGGLPPHGEEVTFLHGIYDGPSLLDAPSVSVVEIFHDEQTQANIICQLQLTLDSYTSKLLSAKLITNHPWIPTQGHKPVLCNMQSNGQDVNLTINNK